MTRRLYRAFLLAATIALGFATQAQAQYKGLFAPAAMNPRFPCDQYLNQVNTASDPATAVLWDSSFGTDKTCLIRFLESNAHRPHAVTIYLENGAGRRNRTLESGDSRRPADFWPKKSVGEWNALIEARNQLVLQSFADRLAAVQSFFEQHGSVDTQVVIVPSLEDNYSRKAWEVLGPFLDERTYYLLVRNPEGSDRSRGVAYFVEKHGSQARCSGRSQIANADGSVMSRSGSEKWFKRNQGCFIVLGYDPEGQGRTASGSFVKGRFDRDFSFSNYWGDILSKY